MDLHGTSFNSDDVGDYFGFVYEITNLLNGRRYIGRKYFWSFRTPKGKKRKVKQESDWKKYYGSCPELKEDIIKLGKQNFSRSIISLHKTKGKTNFEETRQLFGNNVLTEPLTTGLHSSTIATFSVGTTEKTIMAEKTTEELVKMVNDWAVQRIEDMVKSSDTTQRQVQDALALADEFQEWFEDDGSPDIEIMSMERY